MGKGKIINTTLALGQAFSSSVLKSITGQRNSLFTAVSKSTNFIMPQKRTQQISMLRENLPIEEDLIFRGTEGTREVEHIMATNRMGLPFTSNKKASSLDIVGYIRDNDSKYFLSFSPCKETVKPYAVGLSLIPKEGFILVTGLPKVFTVPHKLLHLNEKLFDEYDALQHAIADQDNPKSYQSIAVMTKNNNEITAVLGTSEKEDWRPVASEDIASVVQIHGLGRILSKVMASNEPALVSKWDNPGYIKRIYSLEITFTSHQSSPEELAEMNKKAVTMKLIPENERLLTLDDAKAVMHSGILDDLNQQYQSERTHVFKSVPSNIAVGNQEALCEHMVNVLMTGGKLENRTLPDAIKANPSPSLL